MEEMTRQTFKLHLPGLLKVLAEHLYSNKQVAVRELIQNAHDSCLRRAIETKEQLKPRIDITIDEQQMHLSLRDNGCGLTAEEIESHLTTIGQSYTRELRERLAILSWEEATRLIGQFGFGFLSAFLIASEVTLTTRSYKTNSTPLRWRATGDEYYELVATEREDVGTTIELTLKPSAAFLVRDRLLAETVRKYADFLPVPIFINGDPVPVNLMTPPWAASNVSGAISDYISRAFGLDTPLCIIHLHDQTVDLGHDTLTLPLKGFLFVPPSSVASVREYGDMTVFIRHMFIREHEQDLLPAWARFVRGVIDCPLLQPTASREDIHRDDSFEAIQQALEEQLLAGLRQVAHDDPTTWRKIVAGHSDVITGWAVRDHEFFAHVADYVVFRTSRGHLSLPEYLQQSDGTLYYVTRELGSLQEQLLAEGHDVPVIDASWFAVKPFLEKYVAHHPSISLMQMDGEQRTLLRPVPTEAFAHLLQSYHERGVRARVALFKPADVPAVMLYSQDAEFLLEARQSLAHGELPDPLAGLVGTYLDDLQNTLKNNPPDADVNDIRGTLYLNASCSLIRQLAQSSIGPAELAALTLIHQIARLFSGRTLTAADATLAFRETIRSVEELLP